MATESPDFEVTTFLYLDKQNEVRGLVSVLKDGVPVQTVGSAVVGSDELTAMMRSAVYVLNVVKNQT